MVTLEPITVSHALVPRLLDEVLTVVPSWMFVLSPIDIDPVSPTVKWMNTGVSLTGN